MESRETKTKFPLWVWLLAAVALLMLCAVVATGAVAIGAFSIFSTTVTESNAEIGLSEALEATIPEEETALSSEELTSPTDLPPTNTPAVAFEEQESSAELTPTEETAPADTPGAVPDDTTGPGDNEPGAVDASAAERATIEANVVEIRELAPLESVNPTLMSPAELGQRLEEEFSEQYSPAEAQNDAIALSAFDFIQPDFDIYNFSIGLLTEQVAGFYDPETDEFVIVDDDEEFGVLEHWTHAHEYVHALQDQYFDLEVLDDESLDSEAAFAIQALAEGDATLVQTLYLLGGYFDQNQLFEIMTEALEIDTAVLDSAPPVLAHELEFPYLAGVEFVQTLYDNGGFAAIDAAWENPPQSTEHILHPDRYLAGDSPQIVTLEPLTDTLGSDWQRVDEDILGEFYLREYLAQQLDSNQVNQAATGWGGDRYTVFWNEASQDLVMVLKIAWDSPTDAQEFHTIYPQYPTQLFGGSEATGSDGSLCWSGDGVICLYQVGDQSLLVRAPDLAMAAKLAELQAP